MSQIPRLVVLDDRDSRIAYSNDQWLPDGGSRDQYGSFGHTYLGTETTTQVNGSLSLSFSGTGLWVYGSVAQKQLDPNTYDPVWDCYIDKAKVTPGSNFSFPENNWVLCAADNLDEVDHEITVNVTTARGNSFYVDYIEYRPTRKDDTLLDNTVRLVDGGDTTFFKYSSGWNMSGGLPLTQTDGASVQFDFNGTGFTWIGQIPAGSPTTPATLTYTIDGGNATTLNVLPLPAANAATHFAQVLFTTPRISPASHNCTVTYHGSADTGPLSLDHIFLNSTLVDSSSPSITTPISTATPLSTHFSHKASIGAIIGGVIGGLALIAVASMLAFLTRKRRQTKTRGSLSVSIETQTSVNPFTTFLDRRPEEMSKPSMPSYPNVAMVNRGTSWGTDPLGSNSSPSLRPLRKGENDADTHPEAERDIIRHHDSGIRLHAEGQQRPLEIPPMYSPT